MFKIFIKNFWKEFTRKRAIEFVSFETDDETNKRLTKEFKKRQQEIATHNYLTLMREYFIPLARKIELAKSNLLLADKDLLPYAQTLFITAKRQGDLDEMNCWVQQPV